MATTTGRSNTVTAATPPGNFASYVWAVTRVALGFVFLWAFLDKTFGLGKATPSEKSWLNGGHPTAGFLTGVTGPESANPFKGFFEIFIGHAWADWLFMAGLLGIGVALMLGVAMRIAAVSATAMLVMMWMASLPLENHPFLDDHLVYALVVLGLAFSGAGSLLGLGGWWSRQPVVTKNRWLE
jgi:thiosulfate dehydrogenase [quinone] large subunit